MHRAGTTTGRAATGVHDVEPRATGLARLAPFSPAGPSTQRAQYPLLEEYILNDRGLNIMFLRYIP